MSANEHEDSPADSSTDLNATLAAQETEFVTGEEKPRVSSSTLVMTGMVLAAVGATYFMMMRAGPGTASASTETVAAGQTINQFLNDKGKNLKLMQTMLRDTEEVVKQFQLQPSATQVPLSDLTTNPFRVNSMVAKTDENAATLKRKRDADRTAATAAVQALGLQSVTFGTARRSCLIDGKLYGEGDAVGTFVVERINPKSVVVRRDVFRYEISMTHE